MWLSHTTFRDVALARVTMWAHLTYAESRKSRARQFVFRRRLAGFRDADSAAEAGGGGRANLITSMRSSVVWLPHRFTVLRSSQEGGPPAPAGCGGGRGKRDVKGVNEYPRVPGQQGVEVCPESQEGHPQHARGARITLLRHDETAATP